MTDEGVNLAILTGNLGADPKFRQFDSGTQTCEFRIAVEDGFGDNKHTEWINIQVWGKTAGACNQYLNKGSKVHVEGPIRKNEFTGKDGIERTFYKIQAREVKFLGGGKSKNYAAEAGAAKPGNPSSGNGPSSSPGSPPATNQSQPVQTPQTEKPAQPAASEPQSESISLEEDSEF